VSKIDDVYKCAYCNLRWTRWFRNYHQAKNAEKNAKERKKKNKNKIKIK
jgi:hypothetical protein